MSRKARPVLLAIGDGVASTGFGRVLHSLIPHFLEHFNVSHLAVNYCGDPHPYDWDIYPASVGGDPYGVGRIADLMDRLKPDLVFLVNDIWILGEQMRLLRSYRDKTRIVMYSPVDGGPIDPAFTAKIEGVHRLVAYTEFGRRQFEDSIAKVRENDAKLEFPKVDVIPHGVDTESFFPFSATRMPPEHPLTDRLAAKRALIPRLADPESSFIVLNANRNQPRKRIDLTMDGFARFAKGKPGNVLLYLHMGLEDAGWNVPRLADYYGIQDRLVISSLSPTIPSLPDTHLNLIYNACDVGLNTSTGEGWGLVSFEHAAARGAQVMPAHDTAVELWTDAASLVPISATHIHPRISTEAKIVDAENVADALERLYRNRNELRAMQEASFSRATDPAYAWENIAARWLKLLD
jgi:glycosyltransferase involved in cell wall biosynthesis